ncbi:MAG: hypothetical protein WBO29_07050 [Albidovulum sp.]
MDTDKCLFDGRQNLNMRCLQTALAAEFVKLENLFPGIGMAFVFKQYDGKSYLFANKKMPLPEGKKIQELQGSEAILTLDNGAVFKSIRFIVRGLSNDVGLVKRIDLAKAAIIATERLELQGAARMAA